MELIKDQYFEGERPLYARRDGLRLENVTIGPGESSLKEGANIEAVNCEFKGKYPFWECDGFTIRNCIFREGARAALWYTRGCKMYDTLIEAPKMFRRITDSYLENVKFTDAQETFWDCDKAVLKNVEAVNANYIFMHTDNIEVDNFKLQGNYSFQYSRNVVIRNSDLDTKDAFWESENVTVYDSRITAMTFHPGTGLQTKWQAMHTDESGQTSMTLFDFNQDGIMEIVYRDQDNLRIINSGFIKAGSIGQIILDDNIKKPGNCEIQTL